MILMSENTISHQVGTFVFTWLSSHNFIHLWELETFIFALFREVMHVEHLSCVRKLCENYYNRPIRYTIVTRL